MAHHRRRRLDAGGRQARWKELGVRVLRMADVVSTTSAAAELGIGVSTLRHYFRGDAVPTHATMDAMSAWLDKKEGHPHA